MKSKMVLLSLLVALAGFSTIATRAQDGAADDDVRGAFLTSRPKATPKGTAKTTPGSKPSPRCSRSRHSASACSRRFRPEVPA